MDNRILVAAAQWGSEQAQQTTHEQIYETIVKWDEGGGKRSRRELARRIEALLAQQTTEPELPNGSAVSCKCSICGEWQRSTESGMVCRNGHGGVLGINVRTYTATHMHDHFAAGVRVGAAQSQDALGYAQRLAKSIASKEYPEVTQFEVLGDLMGVLSQIDNMTCGMTRVLQGGPAMMFSPMPTSLEEAKREILSWREMHRQQVAEIKQLRQDAKRYAFLRDNAQIQWSLRYEEIEIMLPSNIPGFNSLDNAIDQTMQGGQQ